MKHFIKNLIDGKSVDKYIIPVLLDIGSICYAPIQVVKIICNIVSAIDSLLTKVKVKTICGIDVVYTDKYEFHLFRSSKHKISIDNDFFFIKQQIFCYHSTNTLWFLFFYWL